MNFIKNSWTFLWEIIKTDIVVVAIVFAVILGFHVFGD